MRTISWSCGGGVQSSAIAALIVQGKLPKPDLAVMVDTEREKSGTWEYAETVLIPNLKVVGVDLHVVKKSDFATVDLYSHKGTLLMPIYSSQGEGGGKFTNYCSGEWKRDVILRWLRAQDVKQCDCWIGISVDEMRRMRFSRAAWARNVYPLIEPEFGLMYRRSDCLAEVKRIGWPDPPRSACWMCPNMGDSEWRDMKRGYPEDFKRACEFEVVLRARDPHAWLHKSCVPLAEVDFAPNKGQPGLFDDAECSSGYCFV